MQGGAGRGRHGLAWERAAGLKTDREPQRSAGLRTTGLWGRPGVKRAVSRLLLELPRGEKRASWLGLKSKREEEKPDKDLGPEEDISLSKNLFILEKVQGGET